jgi:WD40 repeat protein
MFIQDSKSFVLTFAESIRLAPLQIYSAGLYFSPEPSLIRTEFWRLRPGYLRVDTQLPGGRSACEHTLEGHSGGVNSVVFSPDGSRVASGSDDWTARIWDVQMGECQHTLKGHSDGVIRVVFSSDGSRVASGSWDTTVRIWDVQTGECLHTLEGHSDAIMNVVFSPDGSLVASGSYDKTLRVWDIVQAQELVRYETQNHYPRATFSDDSMKIVMDGELVPIPSRLPLYTTATESSQPLLRSTTAELAVDDDWVTFSSERVVCLPFDYRPGEWTSKGKDLVIGSGSGRITFIHCEDAS